MANSPSDVSYDGLKSLGYVPVPHKTKREEIRVCGPNDSSPSSVVVSNSVNNNPEPVSIEDVEKVPINSALVRTVVGDIVYPLYGIDLENDGFIILYIRDTKLNFIPKKGTNYWIGVKIEGADMYTSKVFYSGIKFKLCSDSGITSLIFHLVQ